MRRAAAVVVACLIVLLAMAASPAGAIREAVEPEPVLCGGHSHGHTSKQSRSWLRSHYDRPRIGGRARAKAAHLIRCAETAGDRSRIRAMWRSVALPSRHDLWLRIGRCEQPGRGYGGVYWGAGPTYQGGLGFWYGTWSQYGRPGSRYRGFAGEWRRVPSSAAQAHWRLQMRVANRLYRLYGLSPWGCA